MKTKKERSPIPTEIAAEVLFLSNRTCCICNIPGKPIQIHHIDENPSNNTVDNLSVLCLDCHNETMTKGGFGRKLDASQVRKYKNDWTQRVEERKRESDSIASLNTVIGINIEDEYIEYKTYNDRELLGRYLNKIVVIHKAQKLISKTKWDDDTTYSMKQQSYKLIDFYEEVLKELISFYPKGHFGTSPSKFISEYISSRYSYHTLINQPYGIGKHGTMLGISVAASVEHDLKLMIRQIASLLVCHFQIEDGIITSWSQLWLEDSM